MASNPFGGGGMATGGATTGTSGKGTATVGGSNVISPLALPELLKLFNQAQNQIPLRGEMDSIQGMIQGGMSSPLLSAVLEPALARLRAPQELQQQQFTEAARAAGGLRGSTYGQGMNTLMQNQALQQNDLMGQVVSQVLGQLLQGQLTEQRQSFLPAEAMTNLLKAASPSVSRGGATATSGWENIPPSLGLGTPMSPGGTDFQRMLDLIGGGSGGGLNMSPGGRMTTGGGTPASVNPGINATPTPPQYIDPWASGGGGLGGGSYDIGGGTGYLPSPADPGYMGGASPYQHTYGEWQDVAPYEESFF